MEPLTNPMAVVGVVKLLKFQKKTHLILITALKLDSQQSQQDGQESEQKLTAAVC